VKSTDSSKLGASKHSNEIEDLWQRKKELLYRIE